MTLIEGGCLCGTVRYSVVAKQILWCGHCHCLSCRKATGAAVATYFGVPDGHWRWTGRIPYVFQSSPGVERGSCPTCHSPVCYSSYRFPGEMHFFAATLDDPAAVRPEFHAYWRERLRWIEYNDDLLRFSGAADGTPD